MDSFGSRLRYERERRQIALKSIAESTKISVALLEGLERDDVSRWPSGIFRKSFIRSYAEAIGSRARPDRPRVRRTLPRSARGRSRRTIRRRSLVAREPALRRRRPRPQAGPLAIKLTITWSGSVHHTIGRLADWRIARFGWLRIPIFHSSTLPICQWSKLHQPT